MDNRQLATIETVKTNGNSWVVCKSKSYQGRSYYFNTLTGDAVWNLSDAEVPIQHSTIKIEKAKSHTQNVRNGLPAKDCPEPIGPPIESTNMALVRNQHLILPAQNMSPSRIYNKQIINNSFSSTCGVAHCSHSCNFHTCGPATQLCTPVPSVTQQVSRIINEPQHCQDPNESVPNVSTQPLGYSQDSEEAKSEQCSEDMQETCKIPQRTQVADEEYYSDMDSDWLEENVRFQGSKLKLDVTNLRNLAHLNAITDRWYLAVDKNILFRHLNFLNTLFCSDDNCHLMVPREVLIELREAADGKGAPRFKMRARRACDFLSQLLDEDCAVIGEQFSEGNDYNQYLIDCCLNIAKANYHVVLLSNDRELKTFESTTDIPIFTIMELKEFLSNSPETEMQTNIPPLSSMKITISNDLHNTRNVFGTPKKVYVPRSERNTPLKDNRFTYGRSDRDSDMESVCGSTSSRHTVEAGVQTESNRAQLNRLTTENTVALVVEKLKRIQSITTEKSVNTNSSEKAVNTIFPGNSMNINFSKKAETACLEKNITTKSLNTPVICNETAEIKSEEPEIGNEKAVIRNVYDVIRNDKAVIRNDKAVIRNDKAGIRNDKAVISNDKAAMSNVKAVISNGKAVISSDKAVISSDKAVISNARAVNLVKAPTKIRLKRSISNQPPELKVEVPKEVCTSSGVESRQFKWRRRRCLPSTQTNELKSDSSHIAHIPSNNTNTTHTETNAKTNATHTETNAIANSNKTHKKNIDGTPPMSNELPRTHRNDSNLSLSHIAHMPRKNGNTTHTETSATHTETNSTAGSKKNYENNLHTIMSKESSDRNSMLEGSHIRMTMDPHRITSENMIVEETSTSGVISNTVSNIDSESDDINQNKKSNLKSNRKGNVKMFTVTDRVMEESLRTRNEEWVSRFVQIMEDVLTDVLHQYPKFPATMPPPWSLHEATQCIGIKFKNSQDVTDAVKKLSNMICMTSNEEGSIRLEVRPTDYMKLYSYGVNLVNRLQSALNNSEDLRASVDLLSKLLSDIQNPNSNTHNDSSDDSEFSSNPAAQISSVHNNINKIHNDKQEQEPQLNETHESDSPSYNLRSKSKKTGQDEVKKNNVKLAKKIDNESKFFSSLNLQKKHDITNDREIDPDNYTDVLEDRRVRNKRPRSTKCIKKITFADQKVGLDKTQNEKINEEPNLIRNFSEYPGYDNKLSSRPREVLEMDELDYSEDYGRDYEYVGYCAEDKEGSLSNEEIIIVIEEEQIDINQCSADQSPNIGVNDNNSFTEVFKNVLEYKEAFVRCHTFCVKAHEELSNADQSESKRNDIQEEAKLTYSYLEQIIECLNSIFYRETYNPETHIKSLHEKAGLQDANTYTLYSKYRDIISKYLDQATNLLESVKFIIAKVKS